MAWKKTAATKSAADKQEVGWPEPASAVERTEWIRNFRATVSNAAKY
jgi:hypothetical protein